MSSGLRADIIIMKGAKTVKDRALRVTVSDSVWR